MPAKITLCIAANHLALARLEPIGYRGWRSSLTKMAAFMRAQDQACYETSDSLVVPGQTSTKALPQLIQQGLGALQQRSKKSIKGHRLEVELGGLHSRVGLLTLDTAGASSDIESYAKAWVMHSWGVDPLEHFIRYSALAAKGKFLITCIHRQVVDELQKLCAAEQLTFGACKPALTRHLDEWLADQQSTSVISGHPSGQETFDVVVLAERALLSQQAPIVQFVVFSAGVMLSVSRMWFNPGSPQSLQSEVEKIIQRLRAHHRHRGEPRFNVYTWPRLDSPESVSVTS